MSDICKKFTEKVEQKFNFLFRKKGFKFIGQKSSKGEYCYLFLESELFRIKFYLGPDEFQVLVGTSTAPIIWGEKVNGRTHWYYLTSLVGYLENDTEVALPTLDGWRRKTHEKQIDEQYRLFRKHYRSIEKLFGKGEFKKHKKSYEQYLQLRKSEARKAYEELAQRGKGR